MDEKRKERRLKDENDITVHIVPGGKWPLKEKFFYNYSKDISMSGARIHSHSFLPVDTHLTIEMKLKALHQMITVLGKVKWTKVIFGDESFETGVEFFDTPREEIKKLANYISLKQKYTSLYPV
jgi:hypothetical protein